MSKSNILEREQGKEIGNHAQIFIYRLPYNGLDSVVINTGSEDVCELILTRYCSSSN